MIKLATLLDVDEIVLLLNGAKVTMKAMNIPQWSDEYPVKDDILQDIDNKSAYILLENNKILGYAALEITPDSNYAVLYDGTWLKSTGNYATIHRSAIKSDQTSKGLGAKFFRELEEKALELGMKEIRVDTHEKNLPMRRLIKKRAYSKRGVVYVSDGTPRFVYQKFLGETNE
jgi:GNAT superfamily N-acetyltransferase